MWIKKSKAAPVGGRVETAFVGFAQLNAGVLVIGTVAFFNGLIERLATLATRHAMPTIYQYNEFTAAGGPDELWWQR